MKFKMKSKLALVGLTLLLGVAGMELASLNSRSLADDWVRDHLMGEDLLCRFSRGQEMAAVICTDLGHYLQALDHDGVPAGTDLIISQSWFRDTERQHLFEVLKYSQALSMRPFCEMALSNYNDLTGNYFQAMDGAQLERDTREASDITFPLIREISSRSEYVLRSRITLAAEAPYQLAIPVDGSLRDLAVLVRSSNPQVALTLLDPQGTTVAVTRRTVANQVYVITAPSAGNWRLTITGAGTHYVDVAANSDAPLRYQSPLVVAAPGDYLVTVALPEIELQAINAVVERSRFDGFKLVPVGKERLYDDGTHGDAGAGDGVFSALLTLAAGEHPLTIIVEGTVVDRRYRRELRRMVTVGDLQPMVFTATPRGEVSEVPPLGCLVLDDNPITGEQLQVTFDGRAVTGKVAELYSTIGFHIARVTVSAPGYCPEGEHVVAVAPPAANRVPFTWKFTRTLPRSESIIINEVSLRNGDCWAELYCLAGPLDLANYRVTDLDGEDKPLTDEGKLTVNTGDYVVVSWKRAGRTETDEVGDANRNGIREIFLRGQLPARKGDQLAIVSGTAIIDAVTWLDQGDTINSEEVKDLERLCKDGEWDASDTLVLGLSDETIGRIGNEDHNLASEWAVFTAATRGGANTTPHLPPPGSTAAAGRRGMSRMMASGSAENGGAISVGAVVINEVNPRDEKIDWAELYCAAGPVDISTCILTDLEGEDQRLADGPVTLASGQYAVVHWTAGTDEVDGTGDLNHNGVVDLYVGDRPPTSTDDVLVLVQGQNKLDAVCWSNNDGKWADAEAKDLRELMTGNDWQAGDKRGEAACVAIGNSEQSIGRVPNGTDHNRPGDWVKVVSPTPGAANTALVRPSTGSLLIVAVNPANPLGDTAKLYCVSGSINIAPFTLTDLDGQDEILATEAVTLQAGQEAVAHWGQGRDETDRTGDLNGNGVIDLYIHDQDLAATDDQLVLMMDETIYDAVVWSTGDGEMPEGELKDVQRLQTAGVWGGSIASQRDQSCGVAMSLTQGGIRRRGQTTDANNKGDWE